MKAHFMLLFLFCSAAAVFDTVDPASDVKIIGVKIYDYKGDFKQLFDTFTELGINTVYASESLAGNLLFREQAKAHRVSIFVIEPIFYDPEALKADPDQYAITRTGERAKEDWVEFVCPSRDRYRKQKINAVRQAVAKLQPDGLSLDFIRFFVFWEMVRPERTYESLPNTCFCRNCLTKFSSDTGTALPKEALATPQEASAWIEANQAQRWSEWKCSLITSMLEELVQAAKQARPGILINVHAVPWRRNDFNGAIKKVAGQDFAALSRFTDYLSPMCYASMLHRDASWIHSVVEDLALVSSSRVLPSIQVSPSYPNDLPISTSNFEEAVEAALMPPSGGVVFWSWDYLVKEPAKMAVLKRLSHSSQR
jgi:hypothetical protein